MISDEDNDDDDNDDDGDDDDNDDDDGDEDNDDDEDDDDPNALKAATNDKNRRDLFRQHNANLDQIQKDLCFSVRLLYLSPKSPEQL